jgi:hypothetical protein
MPFDFSRVNPLAVVVAALAAFLVGGLWYTALFGKLWVKLHGYSEEKVKQMQANMSPPRFFGGMLLSYLVLAVALALLLTAVPEPTLGGGAAAGLLLWMATAAIAMTGFIASDKVIGIYWIDVACQFVYLVLMGIILAVWR